MTKIIQLLVTCSFLSAFQITLSSSYQPTQPPSCIDELPWETQSIIIKDLFNCTMQAKGINQQKLDEYNLKKISLPLAKKIIDECVEIHKLYAKPVFHKQFSTEEIYTIFTLPLQEKNVFIRMTHAGFTKCYKGCCLGNIKAIDYQILKNIKGRALIQGLDFHVIPNNPIFKACDKANTIGLCGLLIGYALIVMPMIDIGGKWGRELGNNKYYIIPTITSAFGLPFLALLSRGILNLYNQFYPEKKAYIKHYKKIV